MPWPPDIMTDPEFSKSLGSLRGRLVDPSGKPLADQQVEAFYRWMELVDFAGRGRGLAPPWLRSTAKSASDGTFEVTGLACRHFFRVRAGDGRPWRYVSGLERFGRGRFTPQPGVSRDLGDLVMHEAISVTGTIFDPTGAPVAGAFVAISDSVVSQCMRHSHFPISPSKRDAHRFLIRNPLAVYRRVVETADGRIHGLDEESTITATDPAGRFRIDGFLPGRFDLTVHVPGVHLPQAQMIDLRHSPVHDLGEIGLQGGKSLRGRVVDSAGNPVVDA